MGLGIIAQARESRSPNLQGQLLEDQVLVVMTVHGVQHWVLLMATAPPQHHRHTGALAIFTVMTVAVEEFTKAVVIRPTQTGRRICTQL